jgi:hypothetical protein
MNSDTAAYDLPYRIDESVITLLNHCRKNDWAGFDPYDALNSRVFASTPFFYSRICRIGITQVMKRLPINLRPLLSVSREQNPKAIALFLMACLKLSKLGLLEQENLVEMMAEKLVAIRSENTPYWCWGYSFPWQTRTILVPRGAPNLVCTTFVANALLDLYEENHESRYLSMAASAAEYILNELYWTENESIAGFSYPLPSSRQRVHNANFLGAALLCRIYKHSGEKKFLEPALKVARYSAAKQQDDGSWDYGELPTQRWVDNFHTGYNLCALRTIGQCIETSEFESHLRLGLEFFRKHFFREDGAPGYFHDCTYPIDIHSVAQSIITLVELKDLDKGNIKLAHSVFSWVMQHMWSERGYFYYRVYPFFKNKISYMRWSQAWMLLAMTTFLDESEKVWQGRKVGA